MEYQKFIAMILTALVFSVIGMFYYIYVESSTNFLLFSVLFTLICLFSILYSELNEIKNILKAQLKRGGKR